MGRGGEARAARVAGAAREAAGARVEARRRLRLLDPEETQRRLGHEVELVVVVRGVRVVWQLSGFLVLFVLDLQLGNN